MTLNRAKCVNGQTSIRIMNWNTAEILDRRPGASKMMSNSKFRNQYDMGEEIVGILNKSRIGGHCLKMRMISMHKR